MERRTTHRRPRASQRQTHKYRQVGGVRTVGMAELQTAFKNTGIVVVGTPFAFLEDNSWFTKPTAAANYMTLIAKQDELFILARKTILDKLGLKEDSTDAEIMTAIENNTARIEGLLKIVKACADLIVLNRFDTNLKTIKSFAPGHPTDFDKCYHQNKSKMDYVLFWECNDKISEFCGECTPESCPASTLTVTQQRKTDLNFYKLASVLLRPAIIQNISISAIANIITRFKEDKTLNALISNPNYEISKMSKVFLIEKYVGYMYSITQSLVSDDTQRDVFMLWGCAPGSKMFWYYFFKTVIEQCITTSAITLHEDKPLIAITPGLPGVKTENEWDFVIDFAKITAIIYKNMEKTTPEILRMVMGKDEVAGNGKEYTGMLPASTWSQPLLPSDDGEANITFGKLLKTLTITEVHYLLHLLQTLNDLKKSPASAGAAT